MNSILAQFERLYETKLAFSERKQELLLWQYEFEHNSFSYYLSSAIQLSEIQIETLVMAIKLSLDARCNRTLEYCFEKALSQALSFDEIHDLESYFNAQKQSYTIFIIEGQIDVTMMTFIYQLKESQLLLIMKETCLIGIICSDDPRLDLLQVTEMIETELMVKVKVVGSRPFVGLEKIVEYYHEVVITNRMAKLYLDHKKIVMTNDLGLAHLLKSLDDQSLELIVKDLLNGKTTLELCEEDLRTIHSFFENHLNIAETARQLYVHRNTLIYRLDKYMGLTGLDIRRFDDAVLLKLSIMILQLKSR